jgi:hypothetical protein
LSGVLAAIDALIVAVLVVLAACAFRHAGRSFDDSAVGTYAASPVGDPVGAAFMTAGTAQT